jgi:hypothetical protein
LKKELIGKYTFNLKVTDKKHPKF